MNQVTWRHPHRGDVTEIVCQVHERELLGALSRLGIGCTGEQLPGVQYCDLCREATRATPTDA